jgi:hypothetical protein
MELPLTAKVRLYSTHEQYASLLAFQNVYTSTCNDASRYVYAQGRPSKLSIAIRNGQLAYQTALCASPAAQA